MTTTKRSTAAERLRKAQRAAAKELKLPADSWQVKRFALLSIAHENITARLAAGGDIRIEDLIKVDQQMQEIRASLPPEPIAVQLTVVHTKHTRGPELPPSDPTPPDKTNATDVTGGPSPEQPSTQATPDVRAPSAAPVRRHRSSIHDAVLNGVPARMRRNDYSGNDRGAVYSPLEKAPDWDAKHPVPEQFWPIVG